MIRCDTCGEVMFHTISDLWKCENCGLISSDLEPKVTLYDKDYFNKYVEYSETPVGHGINIVRQRSVANLVREDNLLLGKKLLDFGCGSGSFVGHMRRSTMAMVKGYDIIPGSPYNDPSLLKRSWDIVTFWDSIEHTGNPKGVIRFFKPQYLVISVPSIDGNIHEVLTDWKHYRPYEHIHYYNERSLKALFRACGYKVELINYDESDYRKGDNNKNILTIGGILK